MRIVQVGLGGWERGWAQLLRTTQGVDLIGVVDPAALARRWAPDTLDLPEAACHETLEQALGGQSRDRDGVLVATPLETHRAVAEMALRAGKHVLVEKPLATTLPDAAALVATATETSRLLMVCQNYRFSPWTRAVQHAVAAGELGALIAVRVACRRDTRSLFRPDDFRYQMRHPYLIDMAIHHMDLPRVITRQDVARVYAQGWGAPDSPYRHQPTVVALLTLDGGATAVYDGDWTTREAETSWTGDWELIGERGRLRWTGDPTTREAGQIMLHLHDAPPCPIPPLSWDEGSDRAGVLAAFRATVETGQEPETSALDNIRSLAAVLACARSTETGEVVDVEALVAEATAQTGPAQ
ncbi:MAG: Gfo/Idh/MocA family oxidoreductase [Chloroflexota bacterium]|nr:Gfo/Idh/MocA family oxidoreductase [Chloroflexota bacterium]